MALTSFDKYLESPKQEVRWFKTTTRTTVAGIPFSLFDIAGNPGAGTLAIGNTANGLVHTDATTGYPAIGAIANVGYITRVEFGWTVPGRLILYDRLFSAGAYAYNANVTLTGQPSIAGRIPDGNYNGLELWLETVTAFTGSQSIRITYLDQDNNAGDTGVIATGVAPTVGRMFRMPMAAGDSGLRQVNSVISSVSTAGTFNVHIMRRLWAGRVAVANNGDSHGFLRMGVRRIYTDSALIVIVQPDSTSSALPEVTIEITDA